MKSSIKSAYSTAWKLIKSKNLTQICFQLPGLSLTSLSLQLNRSRRARKVLRALKHVLFTGWRCAWAYSCAWPWLAWYWRKARAEETASISQSSEQSRGKSGDTNPSLCPRLSDLEKERLQISRTNSRGCWDTFYKVRHPRGLLLLYSYINISIQSQPIVLIWKIRTPIKL